MFDPLVRFIVLEGIRGWWADEWQDWSACPVDGDPFPHTPPSRFKLVLQSAVSLAASALPRRIQAALGSGELLAAPLPIVNAGSTGPFLPVCPYTWSKPLHTLNCAYVWPPHLETNHFPLIELDTPEYYGKLQDDKVVHKLLAMGGIRLAAVLNSVFLGKVGQQVIDGPVVS